MTSVHGLTIAKRLKDTLLSYLASSLPVGNHSSQRELGQEIYERWSHDLFSGPYVEILPRFEEGERLIDAFGNARPNDPNFHFERCMDTGIGWADLEDTSHGLALYRRYRDLIWPAGSADAREESVQTTLQRLWAEKRLYRHQWDSFDRVIRQKRNIVVATPTGSGKTECFLIPLLYHLSTEPDDRRQTQGVRALLLYPMNALVEDQMHRLRQHLFWLNLAALDARRSSKYRLARPITFGRYTGDTPTGPTDRDRRPSDEALPRELGELSYREDMQKAPPDILITNFTMLEYMLLRGDDQRLFQAPEALNFLVLDEVHTYSGTQGMEVAMLLRRFRSFLEARGLCTPFRVIAASATLPSGLTAKEETAQFATTLFGASFAPEDVLRPDPLPPQILSSPPKREAILTSLLEIDLRCPTVARDLGGRSAGGAELPDSERQAVFSLLAYEPPFGDGEDEGVEPGWRDIVKRSKAVQLLREVVGAKGCVAIVDLPAALFGEHPKASEGADTLLRLVGVAQVGLRFHYFICEPAGAQLCLNQACCSPLRDGWWSQMFVHHRTRCKVCMAYAYPLLLCRKCGYGYLEGWVHEDSEVGKRLSPEPDEGGSRRRAGRLLFRPAGSSLPCADAGDETSEPPVSEVSNRTLCLHCGAYLVSRTDPYFPQNHACPADFLLDIIAWTPKDGILNECLWCEQHWIEGRDVVTPPAPSGYAASTVLVEELSRCLADPQAGRAKLVSFSDSRQQAAQLAYRFQKTNREFTLRQLIFDAVRDQRQPVSTRDLQEHLYHRLRRDRRLQRLLLDDETQLDSAPALERTLATLLLRECVSAYLTLEAQGLVTIGLARDALSEAEGLITGDRVLFDTLDQPQRVAFVRFLVDWCFRFRYAVDTPARGPTDIDWRWLLDRKIFRRAVVKTRPPGASDDDVAFVVRRETRANRALNFCKRVIRRRRDDPRWARYEREDLQRALFSLWDNLLWPRAARADDSDSANAPLLNFGASVSVFSTFDQAFFRTIDQAQGRVTMPYLP